MDTKESIVNKAWEYWQANKKEGYLNLSYIEFEHSFNWFMDNVAAWNHMSNIPVLLDNGKTKILNFERIIKKVGATI